MLLYEHPLYISIYIPMIQNLIAIFVGSGLGGVCRYLAGKAVQSHFSATSLFPWGTFAVNVTGCLLIGLFYGLFDRYASDSLLSQQFRLLLTVGFCGGFTTFSTFINENYLLFQSSNLPIVIGYVALSVVVGFLLLYIGYSLTRI